MRREAPVRAERNEGRINMARRIALLLLAGLTAGCRPAPDVAKERDALTKVDREWAGTTKDINKFVSYYAPDASMYPPGMALATGSAKSREGMTQMSSAPGFSLQFAPTKTEVSASGDVG